MEMMGGAQVIPGPWEDPNMLGEQQVDPSQGAYTLEDKKKMFREAEEALREARRLAFRDEDFFHNFDDDQWSEQEKLVLSERGQPLYTHNRCKKKIQTLKGMEQRSRTDPKAFPRKPQMEGMAEVATDVLNAIDDKTGFDMKASQVFYDLTVPGVEAVEVVWDEGDQEIKVDEVNFDEFFADPRSRKNDYEDASYIGYAKWFDLDVAKARYQGKEQELTATADTNFATSDYEDKPSGMWTSRVGSKDRVRIVVMYYKDARGDWRLAHFAGSADLYDAPSPWLDDKQKPVCGIQAMACFKDRENRPYGMLRDMIGPQQEMNHYRAKMWHHANNRRTWASEGAFKDIGETKREMAKVDGHISVQPTMEQGKDWGFIDNTDDVQIYSMLLGQAATQIGVDSPNEALVGRQASSQSGRAGEVQRDAGMTEEHDVFDLHRQFKENVYKSMFWLARQFWREPDYLRVSDEKDGQVIARFVAINEPVMGQFGEFQGIRNNVAEMDVDIIVKSMPDVAVLQQEQFQTLAQLAGNGMPIPPTAIIRASQLTDKEDILKEIQQMSAPPPDPMQQQMAQVEMQGKQMDMFEKQASAKQKAAQAEKTGQEALRQAARNRIGLLD